MLWVWLLDFSSLVIIVFSLAGLVLLLPQAKRTRRVLGISVVSVTVIAAGYFMLVSL